MESFERARLDAYFAKIAAQFAADEQAASFLVTHLLPERPGFVRAVASLSRLRAVLPKPKSISPAAQREVEQTFPVDALTRELFAETDTALDYGKVRRFGAAPDGIDFDFLRYVTRERALKEGTPFFLGSDMRPQPHCSFFLDLAKTLKAKSLQDYTYDFLESLDPPSDVLSATEDGLLAYREHCTEHRDEPMSPATWKRRRVTIHNFYDWAVDEAKLLARRPYYRRPNGRDVLSWGTTAALDVRHLTYEQWGFLDRVGLRGLLPDGTADPSFRSAHTLRDSAAGNLSITTGLRLREFRALLDIEVGPPRRDGTAKEVELQTIAKFGLPRTVEIQDATLREIDWYRRTERAAMVRRASRNLWRRREEFFVVDDVNTRQMKLRGVGTWSVKAMSRPSPRRYARWSPRYDT
ncbi:hypothetical protein ABT010_33135 [Streptomyces sp. NPDC002668]|uniref:hypothetical protein n=1 Tax=Streptomyces sp. NPDC002668 TaxID=3154422 RepID=UPI00332A46F0